MEGIELVIEALKNGTSQDPKILKPVEEQLKFWETKPGFFHILAKITSDLSIDFNARWLASMYLKNNFERYWKFRGHNYCISGEEKKEIRGCLLQNDSEPYPQIAAQLSILIARIARMDFPKDWPELFNVLYEKTKSSNCLILDRALSTLYRVICQLSTKRLTNDKQAFQDLSTKLFEYILHVRTSLTDSLSSLDIRSNEFMEILERARLCSKILRKLAIYGFKKPHLHAEVNTFMENAFLQVKLLMELRKASETASNVREQVEKYILLMTKAMIDMLEHHPLSFLHFIRPSIELSLFYAFNPDGQQFLFEKFLIQCFHLMKGIISCREYTPCNCPAYESNETTQAVQIKSELFSPEVCVDVCNKMMSKYFLLSKEELELWQSDPEEFWVEADATESARYNLRRAIENLFDVFFRENSKVLTQFLIKTAQAACNVVSADDIDGICLKDALYNMISIGKSDFFDEIDFDYWFSKTLFNELKMKDSNYRILRRRAIALAGAWVETKISEQNRQFVYEVIMHLLSTEEDMVVKLSAATALRCAVEHLGYHDREIVMPMIASSFVLLYELLKEVKECQTKLLVLDVMSCIVRFLDVEIKPYAEPLIQYLPMLWMESADHNMLRCAIVATLTNLTKGLLTESDKIHPFLISVIRYSVDLNEDPHVYLLEDGLLLWLAMVENCATISAEPLLDLYETIYPLFELGTEDLSMVIHITRAYIVLSPHQFLSKYGPSLLKALEPLMENFKTVTDFNTGVSKIYESILRVHPQEGVQLLKKSVLPSVLDVICNYTKNKYSEQYSMFFCILSRAVLAGGDVFNTVVAEVAASNGTTAERFLQNLLENWSSQLPLMPREDKRKLCAMALAELCSNNWPPVINVWGNAMTSIAEVIFDLAFEDQDSTSDSIVFTSEYINMEPYDDDNQHKRRLKQIGIRDPIHCLGLRQFLGAKLKLFEQNVGPVIVSELFQTLEEDCKTVLRRVTST